MAVKIQLRRGTIAEWEAEDPILMEGEVGVATDGDYFKVGNGVDDWTALRIAGRTIGELIDQSTFRNYVEEVKSISDTGTIVLDLDEANVFEIEIDDDVATELNIDNIRAGAHSWVVYLIQHADEPAVTIDFGVPVEWPDGTVPELAVGLNKLVFDTIDEGATIYGQLAGQGYGDGS